MAKRIESRFIPANFLCVDRLSRMHHCNEQKSTPRERNGSFVEARFEDQNHYFRRRIC